MSVFRSCGGSAAAGSRVAGAAAWRTRLACAAVICCTMGVPTAAAAQASAQYDELIREGLSEFNAANWVEAYNLFKSAHEVRPGARTLRGMGMTSYELRAYPRAIDELTAALESDVRPLALEQREAAHDLLTRSHRLVGKLELKVSPPEAVVFIDRQRVDVRELLVPVGKVTVVAELAGSEPIERVVVVDGGKTYSVELDFEARAQNVKVDLALGSGSPPSTGGGWLSSPWLWVGVGAVLAVVVGAVVVTGEDTPGARVPASNVDITAVVLTEARP